MPKKHQDRVGDDVVTEPEMSTPTPITPKAKPDLGPVYLDLQVEHGFVCMVTGEPVFVLTPGLNLVAPGAWKVYAGHAPVVAALGDKTLVSVASDLSDAGPNIAGRTTSQLALEYMLELELAKPKVAGPTKRQNANTVVALTRKLAGRK